MRRRDPELEPELEAFLEHRPIQRRVPPELRARALARGRAIVAGRGAIPAAPLPLTAPRPMPAARGRRLLRAALVASLAVAGAAGGAVAAFYARPADAPTAPPERPSAGRGVAVTRVDSPSTKSPAALAEPAVPTAPPHPARSARKADLLTAELDLLQRAHAAYTRRDFSVALALVAEHARRFPRAHLAEQREALRVRSLAGSGRADEAHRAAAAFATQFPRSVLLPRVEGGPESAKR